MTPATLTDVMDNQQGKIIPMHPKRAVYLASAYPGRFSIVFQNPNHSNLGENKMPSMPKPAQSLDNGLHTLIAMEVKTTDGKFGPQEEVRCLVEGTEEKYTRIWVDHNNLKRITEASKCGLVVIDGEEWHVQLYARFDAFVAGGKIIAITPARTPAPSMPPVPKDEKLPF